MAMIAAEADIVAIPQTFSRTPSNTANAACPETENTFGSAFYIDIFAQHLSQHLVESAHAVQIKGIDGSGGPRHHDRDSPLRHMRSHHRPPHRRHGQISHSERSCASRHCIDRSTCAQPCLQHHDSSGPCSLTVLSTKQFIDGIFRRPKECETRRPEWSRRMRFYFANTRIARVPSISGTART